MSEVRHHTFYRLATAFPPSPRDYRTQYEKRGELSPNVGEDERFSYFGLSAFDTEEATRAQGKRFRQLGQLIVRFAIPEGTGITWRQTTRNRNHYDLMGDERSLRDLDARKRLFEPFLDPSYLALVEPPASEDSR